MRRPPLCPGKWALRPSARLRSLPVISSIVLRSFRSQFHASSTSQIADGRNRTSNIWIPTTKKSNPKEEEDVHSLLVRAGYLRQAHTGIFHMLPLGLRVQEKIERLIDKNMRGIGASKVSLSSISSKRLWKVTGRYDKMGSELFKFQDRHSSSYLLGPTHEEEITKLVAGVVTSWRGLPLRLYQISRKYRDEKRPRAGLLRGREFIMKDLYTFDSTPSAAMSTYGEVQSAYKAIFDEVSVPYMVSEASTGAIGGDHSHEYHFPSATGEDTIIKCDSCSYITNEECVKSLPIEKVKQVKMTDLDLSVWYGISMDKRTLIKAYFPKQSTISGAHDETQTQLHVVNVDSIKEALADVVKIDTSADPKTVLSIFKDNFRAYDGRNSVEHLPSSLQSDTMSPSKSSAGDSSKVELPNHSQIIQLFDYRLPYEITNSTLHMHEDLSVFMPADSSSQPTNSKIIPTIKISKQSNLLRVQEEDPCPVCDDGKLSTTATVELGHTFHLGTRYSQPLAANCMIPDSPKAVPMDMGCHGIGVTRMIAAVADALKDQKGLVWPSVIAPYKVAIIFDPDLEKAATEDRSLAPEVVYDALETFQDEVVIDDRNIRMMVKWKDADLVGYSAVVVLGRKWKNGEGLIEVEHRRSGAKAEIPLDQLEQAIKDMLKSERTQT